jgi:hypothetical protein
MTRPRDLKRGCTGADVEAWQRVIGCPTIDGVFGEKTEQLTRMWQRAKGLVPDGVVGDQTRAAAALASTLPPPAPPVTDFLPTPATFIAARYFDKGRRVPVTLIVIHTAETPEGEKTARSVGRWFASEMRGKDGKVHQGSTHYGVDAFEIVQYVRESDVSFGAAGTNHNGIHIEHAGRANQTPAQWADTYSETMLRRSAVLVADLCRRHGVPIKRIASSEIRAGAPGICGHADVSRAYPEKAGKFPHWDPGPHFPWAHYLELVMAADGLEHLKPMA